MILSELAVAAFIFRVAAGPGLEAPVRHLSIQQRNAAAQVYVRSATDCIARSVASDRRFRTEDAAANLGDLIVDAVPKCLAPIHAMMSAYDHYFGEGSGEEFFMGPYLDVLPNVLMKRVRAVGE